MVRRLLYFGLRFIVCVCFWCFVGLLVVGVFVVTFCFGCSVCFVLIT